MRSARAIGAVRGSSRQVGRSRTSARCTSRVTGSRWRAAHGAVIPREELEHVLDLLVSMTGDERRAVPGLNPERADIIVAGLAVAAEVMARIDARELLVSRYGIRERLLLEAARIAPTVADPGDARERSVREFAERCHYEPLHAQTVQRLALGLFDTLGERLGCAPEDRALLSDAALLHDIGYHISYERHHKHSYHLILHAELLGMSPTEQVIVANVARYHRGAPPTDSTAVMSAPWGRSEYDDFSAPSGSRRYRRVLPRRCVSRRGVRAGNRGFSPSCWTCRSRSSRRTEVYCRRRRSKNFASSRR